MNPTPRLRAPHAATSTGEERRTKRSDDPILALHYQLSAARKAADLDALVLVDETGCLVAGAGAWPVCEELAAYAPLMGGAVTRSVVSARIAAVSSQAERLSFSVDGQPVILCGRGGTGRRAEAMARAKHGIERILDSRHP